MKETATFKNDKIAKAYNNVKNSTLLKVNTMKVVHEIVFLFSGALQSKWELKSMLFHLKQITNKNY